MRRGTMKEKLRFLVDERRLKVTRIERMIADFEQMDVDLQNEISTEQKRVRIHDQTNFAYPLFAKSANKRSENLKRSVDELERKLEDAKVALAEAVDELNKLEMLEERRTVPELTPTVSMLTALQHRVRSRGL